MPTQTSGAIKERHIVADPDIYDVIMHNDDFTTMEFVVFVLRNIFFKSEIDANAIMLKIHNEGAAVVGTYSIDIAYSKIDKTVALARSEGYPLRLSIKEHK